MAHEKNYLTDKQSFDALVEQIPHDERIAFLTYKFLTKESAFPGRLLIVYTLRNGSPSEIEVVKFGELAFGPKEFPSAQIHYQGRRQLLTPVPGLLADREVFLMAPQKFEIKWAGREHKGELEFHLHYAVLIKTRSRPELQIEGHTYCLALNKFLSLYPDFKGKVLGGTSNSVGKAH